MLVIDKNNTFEVKNIFMASTILYEINGEIIERKRDCWGYFSYYFEFDSFQKQVSYKRIGDVVGVVSYRQRVLRLYKAIFMLKFKENWMERLWNGKILIEITTYDRSENELGNSLTVLRFVDYISPFHQQPILEFDNPHEVNFNRKGLDIYSPIIPNIHSFYSSSYKAGDYWINLDYLINIELKDFALQEDEKLLLIATIF